MSSDGREIGQVRLGYVRALIHPTCHKLADVGAAGGRHLGGLIDRRRLAKAGRLPWDEAYCRPEAASA